MKRIASIALLVALSTGCANQKFNMSGAAASTPVEDKYHHFFINGLAQSKTVDAATACGGADKVARVEVQQTFMNGFFSVITFGIYTPRTAKVYCQA